MKKVLLFVLLFAAVSMAANVYSNPSVETGFKATNNRVYVIFDSDTLDAIDTIATDEYTVRGPYPVASETNGTQFKGVGLIAAQLLAGDSAEVLYQLTRGQSITDTTSGNWNVLDTLSPSGAQQNYVDISDEVGSYLFVKILNYTAGQIYLKEVKMYLRKDYTYYKER